MNPDQVSPVIDTSPVLFAFNGNANPNPNPDPFPECVQNSCKPVDVAPVPIPSSGIVLALTLLVVAGVKVARR